MAKFQKPGWTQFPNEIFDQLMPVLSGAQFKVICLIARQTAGWHRDRDRMSLSTIVERTGLSKQGVVDSIRYLEECEFIVKGGGILRSKTEKPEACWYELNVEDVELTVNSVDRSEKVTVNSVDCSAPGTVNSVDCSTVNSVDRSIRSKETSKEKREEKEKTVAISSDQNLQNLPDNPLPNQEPLNQQPPPFADFAAQSTSYELQLGDSIDSFVQWMYKRKGRSADATGRYIKGKLSSRANTPLREKLERAEEYHGQEDFRTALHIYLDTEKPSLESAAWPLNWFLKDILDYLPDAAAARCQVPATQSPTLAGRSPSFDAPQIAPESFRTVTETTKSLPGYLQYVDKWNTLVPEAPCGALPSFAVKQIEKAIHDPEFATAWDVIVGKCARIAQNRPEVDVSFPWLFTSTAAGPQWQSVYMGKMDWATKARQTAPLSAIDLAIAEAERAERGEMT